MRRVGRGRRVQVRGRDRVVRGVRAGEAGEKTYFPMQFASTRKTGPDLKKVVGNNGETVGFFIRGEKGDT